VTVSHIIVLLRMPSSGRRCHRLGGQGENEADGGPVDGILPRLPAFSP
jgi:hypothetical protein